MVGIDQGNLEVISWLQLQDRGCVQGDGFLLEMSLGSVRRRDRGQAYEKILEMAKSLESRLKDSCGVVDSAVILLEAEE